MFADPTKALKTEIAALEARLSETFPRRNTPPFPVWDASEPAVRAVFDDLVKPGDVVFDVGAHIGALSGSLSRIVGPRGIVVAFEASMATTMQLTANLAVNRFNNVTVIHGAVFSEPGRLVSLAQDGAASRIAEGGAERVETVQIDDYCDRHQLYPSFIKMDIEGAEYHALLGAPRLIAEHRPHFVVEHNVGDDRALDLLRGAGYLLFDAARYVRVAGSADCEPGAMSANIIAIHESRLADTPFANPPKISLIRDTPLGRPLFNKTNTTVTLPLQPGRHILEVVGAIKPETEALFSRASFGGQVIGQLWTKADFFIHNHRWLPFQARHGGDYEIEVGEVSSRTMVVKDFSIRMHRVDFGAVP